MIKKGILTLVLLFIIQAFSNISYSQKITREKSSDLDLLASLLEGSFSSEEQSRTDTDFFDIRLHMKIIWK